MLVAAILAVMIAIQTATGTPASSDRKTLAGNWMVAVDLITPPPGVPPHFLSLQTYIEDGTLLEETNTSRVRSLAHGKWERVSRRQFTRSWLFFRFDVSRNFIGTSKNTATITLNEDGNEFRVTEATVELFDAAGNLISRTSDAGGTEVGTRL